MHTCSNSRGHKVIGYPNGIENAKYPRHRYIFNLAFVCDSTKRTVQYEPLVKKLANYFVHLEDECSYLSNEKTKVTIPSLLRQVQQQLNETRSCTLSVSMLISKRELCPRFHNNLLTLFCRKVAIFAFITS